MWKLVLPFILLLLFGGPLYIWFSGQLVLDQHWQTADRSSAHLAPDPTTHKEAIVQVYAARAYAHRGMFAVHTWIATKPKNAEQYTVYQAIGWNLWWHKPIVDIREDVPDRMWYAHVPQVLFTLRGEAAEQAIPEIDKAAHSYPYPKRYRAWPGPNSNTFIAYVMRQAPALRFRLPTTAIGKDYLFHSLCAQAPSKTGFQCGWRGVFGITLARKEGLELNILGLNLALNTVAPFIHLPGLG